MNAADVIRRGRSIARSSATNKLLERIADSKWGSGTRYAKGRLKRSMTSFSQYMDGTTPCPPDVAAKVKADFPDLAWEWKAGLAK